MKKWGLIDISRDIKIYVTTIIYTEAENNKKNIYYAKLTNQLLLKKNLQKAD